MAAQHLAEHLDDDVLLGERQQADCDASRHLAGQCLELFRQGHHVHQQLRVEVGKDDGIARRLHAGTRALERRPARGRGDPGERAADVGLRPFEIVGGG